MKKKVPSFYISDRLRVEMQEIKNKNNKTTGRRKAIIALILVTGIAVALFVFSSNPYVASSKWGDIEVKWLSYDDMEKNGYFLNFQFRPKEDMEKGVLILIRDDFPHNYNREEMMTWNLAEGVKAGKKYGFTARTGYRKDEWEENKNNDVFLLILRYPDMPVPVRKVRSMAWERKEEGNNMEFLIESSHSDHAAMKVEVEAFTLSPVPTEDYYLEVKERIRSVWVSMKESGKGILFR